MKTKNEINVCGIKHPLSKEEIEILKLALYSLSEKDIPEDKLQRNAERYKTALADLKALFLDCLD